LKKFFAKKNKSKQTTEFSQRSNRRHFEERISSFCKIDLVFLFIFFFVIFNFDLNFFMKSENKNKKKNQNQKKSERFYQQRVPKDS